MRSSNLYIIGWNGFIGRQYIKYLNETGFEGEVFLNSRSQDDSSVISDLDNISVNYVNYEEMVTGLRDSSATILYLANLYSPLDSLKYAFNSVKDNILPFINLLEDIKGNAENIKFIMSSSGGTIYGDTECERCNEYYHLAPKTIYAANKIAQEEYLNVYHVNYGLDYRIARIANPYGPGQKLKGGQGLVPAILQSCVSGESLPVVGEGNATRDYIYIDDLCLFLTSLEKYNGNYRVFNVGSGIGYTILDVINCFNAISKKQVSYHFVQTEYSAVSRIVLDISRAKTELMWVPRTSLSDGISSFVHWASSETGSFSSVI